MKTAWVVLLAMLVAAPGFGLEVDRDELSKGQGSNVTFVNYVGPHSRIDTIEAITGIGRALGRGVGDQPAEFTYAGKYRVIHAVGPAEGNLLDADIFVIESGAEVDDVVNIMRMVSGYLQEGYAYSPADSMTLARFVVYYNAVFRGDLKYLGSAYKSIVMRNVSAENAGIATRYTDWPGKTRMLIPLSVGAQKGNLSAVGAGELAGPKVTENLQGQPGKALPERKDLTELQQRGIEQSQQQTAAAQQQLQQEKQQLQQQTQALQQAQQAAQQAQETANAPGATPEQKLAAQQAAAAAQQQEQATQAQAQKIQQQEQAVAQQQQQTAQAQAAVQQQRQTIAADEQALIQQQQGQQPAQAQTVTGTAAPTPQPAPAQVLFLYALADTPDHLGKLTLIDAVSGKLLAQSDLNTIRGRTYVSVGGLIVVVAGRTTGTGAVRLVALDPKTLAIKQQGKDNVVPTSFLAGSDTSVYAAIDSGSGAYLGRFDATLSVQARSERRVDPYTSIVVTDTQVYVQDDGGNILILNKDDLKEKKKTG